MSFVPLARLILAVFVVLVFPGLLMLTVIGWADESVKGEAGSSLAFAAVLIPIWALWFAAIAWIIRAGRPNKGPTARPRSR